jgi:hypothetical protein
MRLTVGTVGLTLTSLVLASSPTTAMMPNDPQRPLEAKTCRAAFDRVKEAANGSPLVSQSENRDHLLAAIALAERLCVRRNDRPPNR